MPGLLITPEMYFLDRSNSDFAGWQINAAFYPEKIIWYGEIKSLVYNRETSRVSMACAWLVKQEAMGEPQKIVEDQAGLSFMLNDNFGASHDSGGCHFIPGLTGTTKMILHPPGTLEKGEDAAAWEALKNVPLSAA